MTGLALLTSAATVVERNRDTIPLFELRNIDFNLFDNATEVMAQDDRRLRGDSEPGPAFLPKVMVGETDTIGLDFNDGVIGTAVRVRPVGMNHQGLGNFFNNCSFHWNLL